MFCGSVCSGERELSVFRTLSASFEMKKIYFFFAFFLSTLLLNSQTPLLLRSSLGTGGASITVSADGTKSTLPQSIGQYGVTGVFNKKNLELRQGFIQPVIIVKSFHEAEKINLSVYPNPFSSIVYLKLNKEVTGNLELEIFDIAGKPVFVESRPAEEIIKINLNSLYRGIYILNIRKNNIQTNYKIIKN
jgi:hypothetical protein